MTRFGKAFVTLIIGLLAAVSAFAFGAPKVAHASISCPLVSHTTRSFYYDNKDGGAISLYYYYSSLYQCVDVQLVVSVPSSGPSMVAPVDGMVEVFVCASPGNPMFVAGSAFKNASTPRWEFSLALPSAYTNFSFGNNFMVRQ